jgi:hypothetical protein
LAQPGERGGETKEKTYQAVVGQPVPEHLLVD